MPALPLPPGPGFIKLAGLLARRKRYGALPFYREMTSQYGPVSFCKVGAVKLCFLNDAGAVKTVTQDHHAIYTKGSGYQRLRPFTGNGLLTSEGEFWRRQRRLAAGAFHSESLGLQKKLIRDQVSSWISEQREAAIAAGGGLELDVGSAMAALSLRASARALFGIDSRERERTIVACATKLLKIWGEMAVDWLRILDVLLPVGRDAHLSFSIRRKLGLMKEFDQALAELDHIVAGLIEERRSGTTGSPSGASAGAGPCADVLGLLVKATDDEGSGSMSDAQLRDEVMTFLLAGYETTASGLAWALYCLDRHPPWRAKIGDELKAPADAAKETALSRFISETLRLYPPIWRYSREAQQDDEVAGFLIPKGTVIVISPYFLHRNERYWTDPEKFDPDRFLPEIASGRPRYSYLPFGSGPRTCIGMSLALLVMEIAIGEIIGNFKITFQEEVHPSLAPGLTLKPDGRLFAHLEVPR